MRSEGSTTLQDNETKTVLLVKADAVTDLDIVSLAVNWVPGVTIYLLQDGRLHDKVQGPIGDHEAPEAQEPAISCDATFEVRVLNESGLEFECRAVAQFFKRHTNNAPVPSRVKVRCNRALRARFIRDP